MTNNKVKTFRLNRRGNSNYALFLVDGDTVTFRQFRYYTGPMDHEWVMSLQEGRKLYQKMVNSRVKIHHYDTVTRKEWTPIPHSNLRVNES